MDTKISYKNNQKWSSNYLRVDIFWMLKLLFSICIQYFHPIDTNKFTIVKKNLIKNCFKNVELGSANKNEADFEDDDFSSNWEETNSKEYYDGNDKDTATNSDSTNPEEYYDGDDKDVSTNSVSVNSDEYNNGNEDSDSSGSDSKGYDDVDGEGYDDKFDSDSGLSFSYGDGEGSNEKDDGLKFSIVTKSPKGSGGSTLSGSGGSTLSKTTNILSFVPPVARSVLKKDEKMF